jgi:alkyl hydroperoxide reductase subunit AhpF
VTADDIQSRVAACAATCPHAHPSSHRLFETVVNHQPAWMCGGCSRVYAAVTVVGLSRQLAYIELAFQVAADLISRDPHGFRACELLTLIDGAFDALQFAADDFGVEL